MCIQPRRHLISRILSLAILMMASAPAAADEAGNLVKQIGASRGLVALVGEGWGETAISLARQSELLILVQSESPKDVAAVRKLADEAGLLGHRIYVDKGHTLRVHLADNLADAVVLKRGGDTPRKELMRVLQPRGKIISGGEVATKPVPKGTGEWTHPYHGADNNPLSEDRLARAPYLTQFLATPWYGPMPEMTLSSGGRIFKAFGHLAFKKREWPMLSKLIAINGYNGAQLWQRDLEPGFMIHRNTMIATPEAFYLADNKSCKLLDPATGKVMSEIVVPKALSAGPVWKWMALHDGVLYALVGGKEKLHPVHKGTRTQTGWPWGTVRTTYGNYQGTWGFGRTLFAMNPKTKKVLWVHQEKDPIDSRALCMANGKIFVYSHPKWLAAISAKTGKPIWRTTDQKTLQAIGDHDRAQTARLGYATSAYAKCNDQAVFFAGPQRKQLVAVSAKDGKLLWSYNDGNVQLVLRDDGLYAMGRMTNSKKFDYLTGKVLADLQCFRGNCTRATGTVDSIFARGYRHSGTLRYDLNYKKPTRIPGMRPACQDGVVIANGLLYWGPWMCDCNHSLVGVVSLGHAGAFPFESQASDALRLESSDAGANVASLKVTAADWPTYRGNNLRTAHAPVAVPETIKLKWQFAPKAKMTPTAPVSAGGLTIVSGSDGVVRAFDAPTGKARWKSYTGGGVMYPPSIWQGRVYVGSGDGWIYAFEAATGKQLWRFRAAPVERKMPVYGTLSSTWPVASGVMVQDGTAYAAAGIISHDGTHVYALDAVTSKLKWQNNTSGNLLGKTEVTGVSVQGHMLFHDSKVYLAGGNVVSPAMYDAKDGKCLNQLTQQPDKTLDDHWKMQRASRGSELFLIEGRVVTAGRMLYAPKERGPASRYNAMYRLQASAGGVIIQGSDGLMQRVEPQGPDGKAKVVWRDTRFAQTEGVVLTKNAVLAVGLVAGKTVKEPPIPSLVAFHPKDGSVMFSQVLPARPARWGIAVDRAGQIIVSLADGRVLCFGK